MKEVDFLEKQVRTIGFLMSIIVEIVLILLLIKGFKEDQFKFLIICSVLTLIITFCMVCQVKFYKVPGNKYTICTIPALILASIVAFY